MFVRLQRQNLKIRLSGFCATTLESKVARTFKDDANVFHDERLREAIQYRPGDRDDASHCSFTTMLLV